jgi:lysylphosphatidylglycerol synthetase-like protein (DUF2156 family)
MFNKTEKKLISGLFVALTLLSFSFGAKTALAANDTTYNFSEDSGIQNTANVGGYVTASSTPIETVVSNIIYAFLGLVGVIFLGFVMYGAVTWMTSMGNSEKVEQANKTVMNALLGIIITLSAYVVSYFVINYFWPK